MRRFSPPSRSRAGVVRKAASRLAWSSLSLPERAASLAPSRTTKATSDNGRPASSCASGLESTSDSFGKADSSLSSSDRSEEHTSELQSLMRISYAVFCLKKKKYTEHLRTNITYSQLQRIQKQNKKQLTSTKHT